ncbi:uncharacterized protein HKW66_Vig0173430 [Vigna angularis]|uniref:Uncharacterized protein n=1 Tax=Phaseolus angularis TaxID=3914 RepID=A0A8T0JM34_PHAAN|nr:uncharacterized protein HKW66_Vig0173430 [Vigna angularis]
MHLPPLLHLFPSFLPAAPSIFPSFHHLFFIPPSFLLSISYLHFLSIISPRQQDTKNTSIFFHFLPWATKASISSLLTRGEEHSFILRPATSTWNALEIQNDRSSHLSKLQLRNKTSKISLNRRKTALINDRYSILVSCRCNYTASRLFFKQPTNWRPRGSRDIMISIVADTSRQSPSACEKTCQPPVQILTLQASNLTSEDLTLTVVAPASFTSTAFLNSLTNPRSPFIGFLDFSGRVNDDRGIGATQGQSFTSVVKDNEKQSYDDNAQVASTSDEVIPSANPSCTHLWFHSRVPLGCVPSRSNATIKLQLLPLTDGIIVLDTLQIDVEEKGVTYIPERSLKIFATSSVS